MVSTTQPTEFIEFETQVGKDDVIHVPKGLEVPPGLYKVTITSVSPKKTTESTKSGSFAYMIEIAEEIRQLDVDLPPDLAENHDHYAHGAPCNG